MTSPSALGDGDDELGDISGLGDALSDGLHEGLGEDETLGDGVTLAEAEGLAKGTSGVLSLPTNA